MNKIKALLILTGLGLLYYPGYSQSLLDSLRSDVQKEAKVVRLFQGNLIHGGQSSETPSAGEINFVIQHRFGNITNGFYDMFGLDAATIRLGFEYGINDRFSASIGRSTFEKTYDVGLKTRLMSQDDMNKPLTMTVFVQASVNTLRNIYPENYDNIAGRLSYSGQFMAGRKFGFLSLMLTPTIVYNSYDIRISDNLFYSSLGLGGSIRISDRISITGEYFYGFTDTQFTNYNPLSLGVDIDTGGHLFQLMFSNSTGMFNKALLTNNTGSWLDGDIYFGFNLIRTFY